MGLRSYRTDLAGIFSLLKNAFLPTPDYIIWICTGNFNRSRSLINNLISSAAALNNSAIGFSIADCNSTDSDDLEAEIRKIWKGPLVFSKNQVVFTRASAFNKAIEQAGGNHLFVCDADISLPVDFVKRYRRYTGKKLAWFPVCQWQLKENSTDWKWFTAGTGIFGATREQFEAAGRYNEEFKQWGKEDWDLFFRFYRCGIMPLRTRTRGIWHHWHPPSKPAGFKAMF